MVEEKVLYGAINVSYDKQYILPLNKALELYKLILESNIAKISGYSASKINSIIEEDPELHFNIITEKRYKEEIFALILENQNK